MIVCYNRRAGIRRRTHRVLFFFSARIELIYSFNFFFFLHLLWSPGVYQIRQALSWVECKLDSFDENICTINNLFHNTYPIGLLSKRIDSFWWRHKHNQTHKYQPKPYVLWQYWLLKTRRFRVIWTNYSCRTVYLLVYLNWNLCCFYSSNHTTRERERKKNTNQYPMIFIEMIMSERKNICI